MKLTTLHESLNWVTPEIITLFRQKGYEIDPVSRKIKIIGTDSWIRPADRYWCDRMTLMQGISDLTNHVRERVSQDKRAAVQSN